MGNVLNQITSPLGLRLFPGGPYPDAGQGDVALNAAKPLQAAGTNLLNMGQSALPGLYAQYAGATGIQNPFGGGTSVPGALPTGQTTAGSGQVTTPNPYQLSPQQMMLLNSLTGNIDRNRKTALSSTDANLSARGWGKSSAKATDQYENYLADTQVNEVMNQVVQAAHQERVNALVQMLQSANQDISEGAGLIEGNIGVVQNAAQNAINASNQGHADFFSALGAGLGLFGPGGTFGSSGGTSTAGGGNVPQNPGGTYGPPYIPPGNFTVGNNAFLGLGG